MLSGHKMESRAEQKPWKRLIEHILPLVKYSRSKIVRNHINEYTDRVIQKKFHLEIQTSNGANGFKSGRVLAASASSSREGFPLRSENPSFPITCARSTVIAAI